ncbi:MAG: hypothetical protein WBB37_10890 [bacterium]
MMNCHRKADKPLVKEYSLKTIGMIHSLFKSIQGVPVKGLNEDKEQD